MGSGQPHFVICHMFPTKIAIFVTQVMNILFVRSLSSLRIEVPDLDAVVEDGLDGVLLVGHELVDEHHPGHVVVEAPHLQAKETQGYHNHSF